MHWNTVVQAETLAATLGAPDLAILDCRHSLLDPDAGRAAHAQGHIPGALHADMDRDLSGPHTSGAGRHPWPQSDAFAHTLGAWGVTPATQVVAYDGGDGALAARAWFLLRAAGHARVAVLDGGWARWRALGLPVQVETVQRTSAAPYPLHFDATRLLDVAQAQAHLARGGLLLDARASERFRGEVEPIDRAAGHVPGAINRPYAMNLVDGRMKAADVLADEYRAMLADRPAHDVVAMCGSGVTACHLLLAMEHAGLRGARLFTGSWSGWVEDPARPVAIGAH